MKMKTNRPAAFFLAAALLPILSSAAFTVSAEPEQNQAGYVTSGEENPDASDGHMDENDITQKTEKENITPDTENIQMASPTAPQADTPLAAGKVTYETTDNYTHNIYANGQPLIMESSEMVNYAKLYLDSNGNGIGEAAEEITAFQGDGLSAGSGIYYLENYGYFLPNSTIYGGARDGICQYDTSITLTGTTAPSGDYVRAVYGGSKSGTLTGNTHINISGGNVRRVYGGGEDAATNGDTAIYMTGGAVSESTYGGSVSGQITGNTSITIEAGQTASVYGGNEYSGLITGDTGLTFAAGASVNGWVYGGGAGISADSITEVAGSTNILVNGGTFIHNLYGGGGWNGAKTGNSNIIINGGEFRNDSWIYGGGEEESSVTGKVSVTVNGGTVSGICATGAGYNGTAASVCDAEIHLKGGAVSLFSALPNSNTAVNGNLTLDLTGESFSNTDIFLGWADNPAPLKNVSVTLTNGKARLLKLQSPVTEQLSICLEQADITDLVLLNDTLASAREATLSYKDCGSPTGRFGTFVQGSYGYFTDIDNPLLTGSHLYKNQFTSITFQNSYVNFYDDSLSGDGNGPETCTEKLILDGGALRLTGNMLTYMPETEFQNQPLLIRTSSFREGIHFEKNPTGSARLQWMDNDGAGIPENMTLHSIAETPVDTPDDTFTAAATGYALTRDTGTRSDPATGQTIWQGTVWYTDKTGLFCKCQTSDSDLTETLLPLPEGSTSASFTLKDALTGNTNLSSSCPVIGHRGKSPDFTYSIIPDGTTISEAAVAGDILTVGSTGIVHLQIAQDLNGKTLTYDTYVKILQIPGEDNFRFTKDLAEDIPFSFSGNGLEFDSRYSYIWNESDHEYLDPANYTMTLEDGKLQFILKKDYLNQLGLGEYHFQATAYVREDDFHGKRYDHNFKVTIALPTEVNDPVIELSQNRYQYDGTPKEPSVTVKNGKTVIPAHEYMVSYQNNLNAGSASVTITDNPGGNFIINGRTEFEIINEYRPENGVDYITTPLKDSWTNSDFVIRAMDHRLLSSGNTLNDQWVTEIARSGETEGAPVSFYVKNTETGAISLMTTEQYRLDRTEPEDFDIRFNRNSVKKLIHEVTFGLLFRETVDVTITAKDSLSGIGGISYFLSDSVLSEEQVGRITDWTDGSAFSLSPEDAKQFIVYAKAADRAGNLVCFASDGAEFDLTPPAITGVTEDKVYYTTQTVSVTDRHPGTVTLDGQNVSGDLILPGNIEKTYVIKAADQAGNETSASITMKPIQDIAEPIQGLTAATVTSDNQPDIRAVVTELDLLLESEPATEQEKSLIKELKSDAEVLDTQITSAGKAADTAEIQAVEGISDETVSLEDKEHLVQAREALEKALNEYGGNYTEQEKQAIRDDMARIDASLESIQNVQTVTEAIQHLPEADVVSPDDESTELKAKEAKDLYDTLTEHEKSLTDTSKLEQVLEALTDYQILEGNHSQWENDGNRNLVFKANGPVRKFTGILVDGKQVDTGNYTAESGSTVITLKAAFLGTLSNGRHSLTVLYTDGKTSAVFETLEKSPGDDTSGNPSDSGSSSGSSKPSGSGTPSGGQNAKTPSAAGSSGSVRTGSQDRPLQWLMFLLVSCVCMSGSIFYRKKKTLPD